MKKSYHSSAVPTIAAGEHALSAGPRVRRSRRCAPLPFRGLGCIAVAPSRRFLSQLAPASRGRAPAAPATSAPGPAFLRARAPRRVRASSSPGTSTPLAPCGGRGRASTAQKASARSRNVAGSTKRPMSTRDQHRAVGLVVLRAATRGRAGEQAAEQLDHHAQARSPCGRRRAAARRRRRRPTGRSSGRPSASTSDAGRRRLAAARAPSASLPSATAEVAQSMTIGGAPSARGTAHAKRVRAQAALAAAERGDDRVGVGQRERRRARARPARAAHSPRRPTWLQRRTATVPAPCSRASRGDDLGRQPRRGLAEAAWPSTTAVAPSGSSGSAPGRRVELALRDELACRRAAGGRRGSRGRRGSPRRATRRRARRWAPRRPRARGSPARGRGARRRGPRGAEHRPRRGRRRATQRSPDCRRGSPRTRPCPSHSRSSTGLLGLIA